MAHLPWSDESNVIGVELTVDADQEKNEVPADGNLSQGRREVDLSAVVVRPFR